MQRRKFIAGMGSLAAAGAAGIGTGAFSSVQADRDISVDVATDANAFLGIEEATPGSDTHYNGGNEEYVQVNNDVVSLDFTNTNAGGSGINDKAFTNIEHLLTITNRGSDDIKLGIKFLDSNGNTVGSAGDVGPGGPILRGDPKDLVDAPNYDGYGPGPLGVGDSVNMGVFFNLSKQEDFESIVSDLDTMVIEAESI